MYDPLLKSVFAERRMVEILIRDHVPEWAGEIDFSTLREEPTELVSRKTLQRRHPDMIWTADTTGGRNVMFLIEFQRKAERFMALRTNTYVSLALERLVAGGDSGALDTLPEFVCLVLYHGDGRWRGPGHVADLFQRSDPGRFRLVSWTGGEGAGWPRHDLAGLVLGLARNLSPEEMAAQVAVLRRAVATRGDASLDAFMVERVGTMLELRSYGEKMKLGGAKTMDEMVDRFQQGLDELVRRGAREGRATMLRRQVARKFGEGTADRVSEMFEALSVPEGVDRVTDALLECGTGDEFVERVRTA